MSPKLSKTFFSAPLSPYNEQDPGIAVASIMKIKLKLLCFIILLLFSLACQKIKTFVLYYIIIIFWHRSCQMIMVLGGLHAIIMKWLRIRWYERNLLEVYLQFMFVFIFFPWRVCILGSTPQNPTQLKNAFLKYPSAKPEDYR
ncbi:hypothetical protein AAG906_016655 [Vitis piasezkii]